MSQEQFQNDPAILNEDNLWRRIMPSQIVQDHNSGLLRPSSAAFEDSPDGSPMSAIWEKLHRELGLTECDALREHVGFALACFTAGLARELGQGIQPDPLPETPAHVLVFGSKPKKSFSRKLAAAARWVESPSAEP